MSRELIGYELGFNLFDENGETAVSMLRGTGAPGGDASFQDAALPGSMFQNTGGEIYVKKTAGTGADKWKKLSDADDLLNLSWRSEKVRFATDDVLAAGTIDITTITDNESMVIGDIVVGEYLLSDLGGTPLLFEITAKPGGDDITIAAASDPLAANDSFVVQKWLPDSPGAQENAALAHYNGSTVIKLADVDWNFATGINLAAGYAAASGDPAAGDSLQVAMQKVDGNIDAVNSAMGIAQGATDMGAYTGALLNDNESTKQNIQQLETEAEALRSSLGGSAGDTDMGTYTGNIISDNVNQRVVNQELESAIEDIQSSVGPADIAQNTPTTVDTVLVDEVQYVEWEVVAHDIGDPTKVKKFKISGFHNGHAGADATAVNDSVYQIDKIGSSFNVQASAVLAGAAGAQTMGLELETSDSDGIRYAVRRTSVLAL